MPIIILKNRKATKEEIEKMSYEYGNYIKVVVDLEQKILAGGAAMHYDEKKVLMDYGSRQENLWGGGIDLDTSEVFYDSMINIRPNQDNTKREIQSELIRKKLNQIVKRFI